MMLLRITYLRSSILLTRMSGRKVVCFSPERTVVMQGDGTGRERPWNPKEPKMIARKQLLTIALILGGIGLIGLFAISTNTSGITFMQR
jgi:hypothetical protein